MDTRQDNSATNRRWCIATDTGGTFTDCLARDPHGRIVRTKVLSSGRLRVIGTCINPGQWSIEPGGRHLAALLNGCMIQMPDHDGLIAVSTGDDEPGVLHLAAPIGTPGASSVMEIHTGLPAPLVAAHLVRGSPMKQALPPCDLRLATTRATNALLEKTHAPVALFVSRGFGDLLRIGDQQRPDLFARCIRKRPPLTDHVFEIDIRGTADGTLEGTLDDDAVRAIAQTARHAGLEVAAVSILHGHRSPQIEQRIARLLRDEGFSIVSCGSALSPLIGYLRRTETAVVNAALEPVIRAFIGDIAQGAPGSDIRVMTSAGGLHSAADFAARDSLLSGPAAGVDGAAALGQRHGLQRLLAFDMGGTSTDLARFDHGHSYQDEQVIDDVRLRAPALAIETIAAGGGSICYCAHGRLMVGPRSAGADPGPACYGRGGPLTLTDVNLLLGRIDPASFGIPVSVEDARAALEALCAQLDPEPSDSDDVLAALLQIANERMVAGIRAVSVERGVDPADHALVVYGGAGGQHACAIADALSIPRVMVGKEASILSAAGLLDAPIERIAQSQPLQLLRDMGAALLDECNSLQANAAHALEEDCGCGSLWTARRLVGLRLAGQHSSIELDADGDVDLQRAFERAYTEQYGYAPRGDVEVATVRVVVQTKQQHTRCNETATSSTASHPSDVQCWLDGAWQTIPQSNGEQHWREPVEGPALVRLWNSSVLVEHGWRAERSDDGTIMLHAMPAKRSAAPRTMLAAARAELCVHRLRTIADEMGRRLQRTAMSPNIKQRRDYSCAVLDPDGRLVVNGAHIPVHLGALGMCVRKVMEHEQPRDGDVWITNHPAWGGSHLPDITMITPVFHDGTLLGYVANRAHHAEIGGAAPGSMPAEARTLADEGVIIEPQRIIEAGEPMFERIETLLRAGPYPTRDVRQNIADIRAQIAGNAAGAEALRTAARDFGSDVVAETADVLNAQATDVLRTALARIGTLDRRCETRLDDGRTICAHVRVVENADGHRLLLDFAGTSDVHPGNLNAPPCVGHAVVLYVLRLLGGSSLPLNEGPLSLVQMQVPPSLLNPRPSDAEGAWPAVVGGNVEISQQLADVLCEALGICANGPGTMNNVLFGNHQFGCYETIGGGAGGGPEGPGAHGVHVHMTNTRITDPEILEHAYPVRLDRFEIRRDSGGLGRHPGGDGLIRAWTFREPVDVSVLTQRRAVQPAGMDGGGPGRCGCQWVERADGSRVALQSVDGIHMLPGDRLVVHTPGGGGWG